LPSFPADLEFLNPPELNAPQSSRFLAAFSSLVALKAGEQGAWLCVGGEVQHVPGVPARVVDTTGAGDAWNGAFLHALARGDPPGSAAQLANTIAAAKLAFRGAIPARSYPQEEPT